MTRLRFGVVPPLARDRDIILIGLLAAAAFVVGALVWPLFPGRDAQTYLMYYLEMGRANPVFPTLMLFRTPGAPLFFGPPLMMGLPVLAEVMLGITFVAAILSIYLAGSFWSRRIGLGSAIVVMLYPAYQVVYHQVSSDGIFTSASAIWILLLCAAVREPTTRKFVVLGCYVFVLTMIRPSSTVFLGLIVLLLFVLREPMKARIRHVGIAVGIGAVLVFGWAGYNSIRYGDFTLSRIAPMIHPWFRLFAMDRLIRPENGPASRALANAVTSDLLTREPYRSHGVTLDFFLTQGKINMLTDVGPMSDRVWGWDADYEVVKRASREAILNNPVPYAKGVARTVMTTLTTLNYPPAAPSAHRPRTIRCELGCRGEGTVVRNGKVLPAPYYPAEMIPTGTSYWLESTPDGSISTDWSNLSNPQLIFRNPAQQRAFAELSADLAKGLRSLPPRKPVASLMGVANLLTELLPPMLIWLLLGVAGLVWNVRTDRRLLVFLPLTAVGFILLNALGLPPTQAYRLPFDPMMIMFGVAGFFGTRRVMATGDMRHEGA